VLAVTATKVGDGVFEAGFGNPVIRVRECWFEPALYFVLSLSAGIKSG
jgi:hypothetical protein